MKILLEVLPPIYRDALKNMAHQTSKDELQLILEGIDLCYEKYSQILAPLKQQPNKPVDQVQNMETPICSSQLEIIPTENSHGLLLELDDGYWLENKPYTSLNLAMQSIKEYEQIGRANLNNWNSLSGEYPEVFLQKPGGLPHIWLGQNSACKILNNKDVKLDGFKLSTEIPTQNVCKSCVQKYLEIRSPKFHLSFDSKKRLLPLTIKSFDPLF